MRERGIDHEGLAAGTTLLPKPAHQTAWRATTRRLHPIGHTCAAIRKVDESGIMVNDTSTFRANHMPYGGNKLSGVGREGVEQEALMLIPGSRVLALLAILLLASGCCTLDSIHTDRLPDGTVGQPYSFQVESNCKRDSACGGVWRTVGVLPPGLELSHDGRLAGRPTLAGSYLVTVSLEDCGGDLVTSRGLSLTVNAPR